MSVKIKRTKKLFEDGEAPQTAAQPTATAQAEAPQTAAPQTTTTATPQAQPTAQAAPQPNAQQPQNAAPQTQAAPQQGEQQQQKQQSADNSADLSQKVQKGLEYLNNVYQIIATNPEVVNTLKKTVPEFDSQKNPSAKPAADAWTAFKNAPSEETYKKFVEEFSKFGSSAAAPQAPQPNQPSADTSNATANATPQAQAVVANNESVAYTKDFGQLLMERLQNEKMMNRYRGVLVDDYDRSVSRL